MRSPAQSTNFAYRVARPFVSFVERFYPDPFIFVIALTMVTFAAAFVFTDTGPVTAIEAWGTGLAGLMSFTAQLAITLITAHVLAHTQIVQAGLKALARVPRRAWHAYALTCGVAGLASLIAWPLGLVAGATLAVRMSTDGAERGIVLDYPLLVASAYSGFVIWHMGYTGSAPLFVATPGHAMESITGIIPVQLTTFSWWNLVTAGIVLISVSAICALMQPPKEKCRKADIGEHAFEEKIRPQTSQTLGEAVSNLRVISLLFGVLLAGYLLIWFTKRGFSLNLDIVNWTLLSAGLLLVRSPAHYIQLALDGGKSIGALLIQYPFYAGIMGLMVSSGLVSTFSDWLAGTASHYTLPIWAFLSAGVVNIFIPSGGGQWAVQGPVFLESAEQLGVPYEIIVMAIAYGDQWTNMIQPFWTIPLLALAGLKVRDVMGYTFVTLLVSAPIFIGGLMVALHFG